MKTNILLPIPIFIRNYITTTSKLFNFQSNRKRKHSANLIQNGKVQKTETNQVLESQEDASDNADQEVMEDQDVEDIEEELKTSGSFNMKKFREKLKSGDFITGKNNLCGSLIENPTVTLFHSKSCDTFFKKLLLTPV